MTDVWVRRIGDLVGRDLGQRVIVENRPGATATIGAAYVAAAKPDGYTLLTGPSSLFSVLAASKAKLPIDLDRSFTPITRYTRGIMLLVVPASLAIGNVHELVALAKANPGKLNYGTVGTGSLTHLTGEVFEKATGTDLTDVPYKGGVPALIDLVAGVTHLQFDFVETSLPHIKSGKLRPLMVTSEKRNPLLPNVPTAEEAGLTMMNIRTWGGFFAPAGTPPTVIGILNKAFVRAVATPAISNGLRDTGSDPDTLPPKEFAAFIAAERKVWAERIKTTGVKIQP